MVHNFLVLQTLEAQPVAAHAVHAELARLLDEDNETSLGLPDEIIEDIKGKPTPNIGGWFTTKATIFCPGCPEMLQLLSWQQSSTV